jgi:hypothetical protein
MSSNAEVVTAKNKRLAVMPKIKSFMGLFAYIFNDKTCINSCQRLGNKKAPTSGAIELEENGGGSGDN